MHKEKLMCGQGKIADALVNILVDSGVSYNFTPIWILQAMHLPVRFCLTLNITYKLIIPKLLFLIRIALKFF